MARDKLTPKQQRFVEEYLIDFNATQAAIRAGYSEVSAAEMGCENLMIPKISQAINEAKADLSRRAEISQEWVIQNLKRVASRCMQVEPVYGKDGQQVQAENDDGELVPCFTFNATGANKAIELIGKHIGMFKENAPVQQTIVVNVDAETLKAHIDDIRSDYFSNEESSNQEPV
jgi:phage terminase small subunit